MGRLAREGICSDAVHEISSGRGGGVDEGGWEGGGRGEVVQGGASVGELGECLVGILVSENKVARKEGMDLEEMD